MFKAKLTNMLSLGAEFIEFDYNPDSVTVGRTAFSSSQSSPRASANGGSREAPVSAKPATLTLGKFYLEGEQCKVRSDLLMSWMNPGGGLIGMVLGAAASALGFENLMKAPPPLLFIWGPPVLGFSWIVQMKGVTVKYVRVS
ncbi:MAG TPA: hypothetical protein VF855_10455, partial [Acidimicrobiales bacterium]